MPMPTALTQATDFIPGRNLSTDARGRKLHDAHGTAHCLRGQGAERALRRQSARTVLATTGWMISLYLGIFLAGPGPGPGCGRFLSGMAGGCGDPGQGGPPPDGLVATLGCLYGAPAGSTSGPTAATAPPSQPRPSSMPLSAGPCRQGPPSGGVTSRAHAWMPLPGASARGRHAATTHGRLAVRACSGDRAAAPGQKPAGPRRGRSPRTSRPRPVGRGRS